MIPIRPELRRRPRSTDRAAAPRLAAAISIALGAACLTSMASAQADPAGSVAHIVCENRITGEKRPGSGVVISEVGHLLTAKHVLPGEADEIDCRAQFGTASAEPNRDIYLRAIMPDHDAAVFQFGLRTGETFVPVEFAALNPSMVGVEAEAFGYAVMATEQTAVRFPVSIGSVALSNKGTFVTAGQISEGMSGGPVLLDDKLIGIVAGSTFSGLTANRVSAEVTAIEAFYDQAERFFEGEAVRQNALRALVAEVLASEDACTAFLRQAVARRFPSLAESDDVPASVKSEVAPYWVTITTGPAQWLNCDTNNITKTVYFPIGLLLRPVREITLSGERRTVYQTEYGLRVLIDPSAVAPVTEEDGYVFAEGSAVYNICVPGGGDGACDPGEEFRLFSEERKPWPFLTGFQSYLYVRDPAAVDALAEEFASFKEYQVKVAEGLIDQDDPFIRHRRPAMLEDDPACAVQEAYLYRFHRVPEPDEPGANAEWPRPLHYSLCTTAPDGAILYRRVKLVTVALAEARFEHLWSVYTMRRPTPDMLRLVSALAEHDAQAVTFIDCGEARGPSLFDLAMAPLNRNTPLDIVEVVRAGAANSGAPPRRQYHFRPYQAAPELSSAKLFSASPLFHEVELEVACGEDMRPAAVESLRINFSPVFGQDVVLRFADMNALYEEMGNKGRSGPDDLRIFSGTGVIERICDYGMYVSWRQLLVQMLDDHPTIVRGAEALEVSAETMAVHIAHLILATVFTSDVELRTADNPYEGC